MKLQFWGATDEVTGSMTFIHCEDGTLLIDCGLTQGTKETEKLNFLTLPIKPENITAVIITHAHLDHSGYLPRLVKNGFKGNIYCTPSTAKLMRIILLDSAKLNEDIFYTTEDVQSTLKLIRTKEWHEPFNELGALVSFFPAGHILGASSIKLKVQGKTLIFSGDLGRYDDPILPKHPTCPKADIIVMESTYGGKNRTGNLEKELHSFLATIARESRVGIIASFAVARAQMLLTLIHEFYLRHPEEKARVCIDSPMMAEANKVYRQFAQLTLHPESVYSALEEFDLIEHRGEWESLSKKTGPLIILSSSGMLSGGRINRHLYNWRNDEKAILFLPGYQGEGTPGKSFLEGQRNLKGPDEEYFQWRGEVWTSEQFSSHGDQRDLMKWITSENKTAKIFLLHGEPGAKVALKKQMEKEKFTFVELPLRGQRLDIDL